MWQRRQPLPQQVTTEPAPMEGVERTNTVVVRGLGQEVGQSAGIPPRRDSFAMEVDWGRNCYTCYCRLKTLVLVMRINLVLD